eukprot:CFRG2252T1
MGAVKRKRPVISIEKNRHRIKAAQLQAIADAEEAALKAQKKAAAGATKKVFKDVDKVKADTPVTMAEADSGEDVVVSAEASESESTEDGMQREDADRELIDTFHTVQKQISQLENSVLYNANADAKEVAEAKDAIATYKKQLNDLGGLAEYQRASTAGEAAGGGFDSSRFVLKDLGEVLKGRNRRGLKTPLAKLLDVGAIRHRYNPNDVARVGTKLDALSIDLETHLADEKVHKADFFQFAPLCLRGDNNVNADTGAQKRKDVDRSVKPHCFDIVVLSLVLNFVSDPRKRAEMLLLTRELLSASTLGIMYVVLPSACLNNSRYLNEDLFRDIVETCGFKIRTAEHSKNGKLFFAVCQLAELYEEEKKAIKEVKDAEGDENESESDEEEQEEEESTTMPTSQRKVKYPLREINRTLTRYDNGSYNNFCIIVKPRGKGIKSKSVHAGGGEGAALKKVKLTAAQARKKKKHEIPTGEDNEPKIENVGLSSNQRKRNRKRKKIEMRAQKRAEREANPRKPRAKKEN